MNRVYMYLAKFVALVCCIPSIVFLLFYLGDNSRSAWFFAAVIALGDLQLFVFSPDHSIIAGAKTIAFFDWLFAVTAAILCFLFFTEVSLTLRVLSSVCLFLSFVGFSVRRRKAKT